MNYLSSHSCLSTVTIAVPVVGFVFVSVLSYETQPLPTKHLSAAEVLEFRDKAWKTYFTNPDYLGLVEKRFGSQQKKNVEEMSNISLKRKILGD